MAATQKFLVIDDSGVIRKTVRDMLPTDKVQVLEAKNGEEGINLIRQEHPDVIMLDFILPKVSGWDVFQQIRNQQDLWDIALVIMSGRKEEVTGKISEPFEYFAFVEKPFDKTGMFAAIKEAVNKAKKRPVPTRPPIVHQPTEDGPPTGGDNAQLQQKIIKMQKEIDELKKQVSQLSNVGGEVEKLKAQVTQLVTFIKQKLK